MSAPSHAFATAVAATAAAMLLIAWIFFYFFQRFAHSGYHLRQRVAASFRREAGVNHDGMKKVGSNMKGLLVEENGIDILYMMDTEGRQFKTRFPNKVCNPSYEDNEEEKRIDAMVQRTIPHETQEAPLLCEQGLIDHEDLDKPVSSPMILEKKAQPPPPPPPPPPPLSPPRKEVPKAPPLPCATSALKASGFISSLKPPPPPKGKASIGESSREKGAGQTRLKPLHWDKVVADVDHSTVWDRINDGSFRFDDELIETLFGYSTNNQTHERNRCLASSAKSNSSTSAQLFLLDPRKSQNTAIVLRSLAISSKEIMDALLDGQGLSVETLERLTKIAPNHEEETKIIQFSGNPNKLADADSFLYYILKAVPTAFVRLKTMLFRSNYDCEVVQLKEHLQSLEMSCKEMRTSGLLLKFLEAILKAGNRMNAGTSRGNAQGFNLSALRKLPDVKSIGGKTSLLHFIVEQVVQSEGRRQAINQEHNLHRISGEISNTSRPHSDTLLQHKTEREFLMLGLPPVIAGIRDELSEVKKAASIEHQSFISMFSTLNAHVTEIQQIITCCGNSERGGFIKEMQGFLEECKEELKVVEEDQIRIMELVRKTNEYYLGGGSKDNMSNPFELFVIVRDFVDMVDEVCMDLKRKLEKKNAGGEALSTPPLSPSKKAPLRFPNFDLHFLSSMSAAASSTLSSDDDF